MPQPFPVDHPNERNMSEGRYNFVSQRYERVSTVLSRYEQNHRREGDLWEKLTYLKVSLYSIMHLGRQMHSFSSQREIAELTAAWFGLEEQIREILTAQG